jgi:hypothetical protein
MVLWVEGALPCVDADEARVRFVPIEGPEPNRSKADDCNRSWRAACALPR